MPFQKGQSGNPAGRPRGIVNRATALAQNLLSEGAEGIARKALVAHGPRAPEGHKEPPGPQGGHGH
jgi:Family of unknown function (DUF5681)